VERLDRKTLVMAEANTCRNKVETNKSKYK
jgi:hypothetical protein